MWICLFRAEDNYTCWAFWEFFLFITLLTGAIITGYFYMFKRYKTLLREKTKTEKNAKKKIQALQAQIKTQMEKAYKNGYEKGKKDGYERGKQEAEFEIATHLAAELIERKHRGLLSQLSSLQKAIKKRNTEIEHLRQRCKQLKEEKQKLLEEILGYKDKYVDLTAKIRLPILLAGLGKRFEQTPSDLPKVLQFCERKLLKNKEIGDPK